MTTISVAAYEGLKVYNPDIKYTHELVLKLGKIDRICGALQERKFVESWEKVNRFNVRCRSIADALNLEGIGVSLKAVTNILEGSQTPKDVEHAQEALNYNQALSYVDLLVDSEEPFSENVLKEFNRICLQGVSKADQHRGEYRTIQNWVVDSEANEIIYTPPSPEAVPDLTRQFLDWYNQELTRSIHPVLLAGLAHRWLLVVNPFVYGTVRTACLLTGYILRNNGYSGNCQGWYEVNFFKDINNYYSKLFEDFKPENVSKERITGWLEYFTDSIYTSVRTVFENSSGHLDENISAFHEVAQTPPPKAQTPIPVKKGIFSTNKLNERQRLILQLAQRYEKFHRRDINAELDIAARYNPKTISRDLKAMVSLGLLNQGGERKGIYYSLNKEIT